MFVVNPFFCSSTQVNILDVQGSGKDGRILKDDIIRYVQENQAAAASDSGTESVKSEAASTRGDDNSQRVAASPPTPPSPPPRPSAVTDHSKYTMLGHMVADKREQIKGVKKAMVKTMTLANNIPHFSYCDEFDMSNLVESRRQLKQVGKERGISISYMPIIIKVGQEKNTLV